MYAARSRYQMTNVLSVPQAERGPFLRLAGLWTFSGLLVAYTTGAISTTAVMLYPILLNRVLWIALFFVSFFVSHYLARAMVVTGPKLLGFVLGCAAEGVALGYLLLFAVHDGAARFGAGGFGPYTLIGEAAGLTLLSSLGMVLWLWTQPRDLSIFRGLLFTASPGFLVLMVVNVSAPIGGLFGLAVGGGFVAVSAAGLLYNFNRALRELSCDQPLEAGYEIAMGILVLFWNILALLMRMAQRD
ncbi:MAG TPA: Bax inhibitor-1 family protein [Myxococcota bacterium]|nr:Bax inhibitor-1 family protein [Myxococcota bacterium]